MPENPKPPVSGPFPIDVESIPTGVTLDIERFVRTTVSDVVDKLLGEYADRFDEVAEQSASDPYTVQMPSDLLYEALVEELTAEVATKLPVYGPQVMRLSEHLRQLAQPKAVPSQRDGGAAA